MALEPITRQEKIISGENLKPITRMERFLKEFGGGGSGGVSPEEVTTIVKEQFPGGVGYEEVQTVNEPLNITWDGNTEGLVSVNDEFFKVSDVVLTDEQVKTSTMTTPNGTYPLVSNWDEALEYGDIVLTENCSIIDPIIVIRKPGAVFEGMEFPEIGVYTCPLPKPYTITTEPIEQTKVVTKKLDAKYLPEGGFGYSEVGEKVLFDGDVNAVTGNVTTENFIVVGQEYTVVFDDVTYNAVATEGQFGSEILPTAEDGTLAPFFMIGDNFGVTIVIQDQDNHHCRISTIGEKIKTIDPKYLPAGAGAGGGGTMFVAVNVNEYDEYTVDKSFEEIEAAIQSGVIPYCVYGEYLLHLVASPALSSMATYIAVPEHRFSATFIKGTENSVHIAVAINSGGSVSVTEYPVVIMP